jgi:hypothetical protein
MQETEVRRGDNRKVFDAVDTDGNGFLTYQDISFLSQEMGEKLTFQQLNTIMDTATDEGTMRRLTMERFEEVRVIFLPCSSCVVVGPPAEQSISCRIPRCCEHDWNFEELTNTIVGKHSSAAARWHGMSLICCAVTTSC